MSDDHDTTRRPRGLRYAGIAAAVAGVLAIALVTVLGAGALRDRSGNDSPRAGDQRAALTEWAAGPSASAPRSSTSDRVTTAPGPGADGGTRRATRAQSRGLVRIIVSRGSAGATATGMVLSASGRIVTNRHLVAGANRIEVTVMATGQRFRARLVGSDRRHDVAVLHAVGASGLARVRVDRSALRVGQRVTTVGDAGGLAGHLTAAPGRVRSVDRVFIAPGSPGEPGETLHGVDELTCDVAPGDSGGATYDRAGAVVGMTTGMIRYGSEPAGITIPIATVLQAVARIAG